MSLAHQAYIALGEPVTGMDEQGSRLGSCPTFPSSNPQFKPTFGSLTLCQVLSGGRQQQMQSGREDTLEERYTIKLCFKLGKNATETYGMIQTAFRPSCMNRASVFEWHKGFEEGRESVRDVKRCWSSREVNRPEWISQRVRIRVRVIMLRF